MKVTDQIEFKAFDKLIDKFLIFKRKHSWIDYIIAPVIVMIIVLIVYAMKGVYPFGRNTIAYYDMPTQYVPFYSHAWDFLHGRGNLYLSWYLGLGASMVGAVGNYILFPTNLFLYFTTRNNILYSLSFLLLIQMMLSAFTMSFYCKKRFNITTWTVCAGILYTCSGYVIQYYTNIFFLDYVIILPLLVWSLESMMKERRFFLYTFLLFWTCIPSFVFAAMVVIYLIFKVYFMLPNIEKEIRGSVIRLFVLSSIIAVLLSQVVMLPVLIVTLGTTRMDLNEGFDYFNTLRNVYCYFRREKYFMMFGSELAVSLVLLMFLRGKEIYKKYRYNLLMIVIVAAPIIMEGINILWHFGSYKHFPIRNGYMITFEFMVFACEYIKNESINPPKVIGRIAKVLGTALIPFISYVLWAFFKQYLGSAISDMTSFESYKLYFVSLIVTFFIIILMDSKRSRNIALVVLVMIQAFCGCYGLIAPETAFENGARVKYILKSLNSYNSFQHDEKNYIDRVKSDLLYYEPNYGLIIEKPSIGSWIYGISADTEELLVDKLGYDGAQSTILDEGGTVFSDALLGVSGLLSDENKDRVLFGDKENGLFKSKYRIPFGILVEHDIKKTENRHLKYQNELFKDITGLKDDLIKISEAKEYLIEERELDDKDAEKIRDSFIDNFPISKAASDGSENIEAKADSNLEDDSIKVSDKEKKDDIINNEVSNKEFILNIPIQGKQSVYLDLDKSFSGELSLIVDGRNMFFSSYLTENSNTYPNVMFNGILSLGSKENESLEVKIYTLNDSLKGINIGILDLDTLKKGIDEIKNRQELSIDVNKSGMHITGKVNSEGILFFPVGYSENWHVKLNGKKANIIPYIDNAFIAVDVDKGDVTLDFSYRPKGLITGLLLTSVGIISFVALFLVRKHGGLSGKKCEPVLDCIFLYGFKTIAIALLIVMYIIPFCVKISL